MCLTNDCCDDNFNGRILVTPEDNPNGVTTALDLDVIGISPIRVVKSMRGTTTVFTISLYVPKPPTTSLTVNPPIVEFNKPFTAVFTGTYLKGSDTIATKTLTPQSFPIADLSTSPFTFNVSGTPSQIGNQYTHTLTVTDIENQTTSSSTSIEVQYRYYRGLIQRNTILTASATTSFESGLGSSIQAVFGPKRHYVNASGTDSHFCWLRPVDSPQMGTPVGDGNFPYETVTESYTITLNGAEYAVIKTINFYPTSTDVELSF